jgi:hypothetical protein
VCGLADTGQHKQHSTDLLPYVPKKGRFLWSEELGGLYAGEEGVGGRFSIRQEDDTEVKSEK